jgi:hypothetical protein
MEKKGLFSLKNILVGKHILILFHILWQIIKKCHLFLAIFIIDLYGKNVNNVLLSPS